VFSTLDVEEQSAARVTYQRGLTASGLVGGIEIAAGEAEPGGDVRTLGAVADSVSARFTLMHPIFLGRRVRVRGGVGLDGADQTGDLFLGQVRVSDDKTRNAFARLEAESSFGCGRFVAAPEGACWRFAGQLEARKGLDSFGASDEGDDRLARPFADPQANVLRAGFEAETPSVAGGFRARLTLTGQAADKPLMAFEEMNLGNYTMVRGYDPGAIAGDSGIAGSFEVMTPEFQIKGFGFSPFGFYDAARIWNEDPGAPTDRDIGSVGAGLRLEADGRVRLEATWAKPLHAPLGFGEPEPTSRVLFSVTASIPGLVDWAA
jgi:hemolysin activation/secretion protein